MKDGCQSSVSDPSELADLLTTRVIWILVEKLEKMTEADNEEELKSGK